MPLAEIQKYTIVVKHTEGYSARKIAIMLNLNRNTVNLWLTRYKKGNLARKPYDCTTRRKINTV